MVITLYLGIPPSSGIDWTSFASYEIQSSLKGWLQDCCGAGNQARIAFTNKRPNSGPFDTIVYLVGQRSDSVITRVGAMESGNLAAGQTTIKDHGMLSEVYVNPLSNYGIAATIYHEMLHNKLGLSANVHGTTDGNFTTATAPYSLGGPSAADQNLMRSALVASSAQFEAGFDVQ